MTLMMCQAVSQSSVSPIGLSAAPSVEDAVILLDFRREQQEAPRRFLWSYLVKSGVGAGLSDWDTDMFHSRGPLCKRGFHSAAAFFCRVSPV